MPEIIGTGLTGLVGSRFVELNPDFEFSNISLETGYDILKPETLDKLFAKSPAKFVVHFAAFTDTNKAWEQRGDKNGLCYQLNVVGTQNIVNLCQKYGKHLIHISTDYVFDGSTVGEYTEEDTPNPIDWYGETKYLAEQVVTDGTVVRIASPYRAGFDQKVDLVRKIIGKLKNGEICRLFNDQFTTPTFIDDIGIGLRRIIDHHQTGIFHLVGSSSQSVYEMGQEIAKRFNFSPDLVQPSSLKEYLSTPNARPYAQNLSLSNSKFITTFGYTPKTLSEGLLSLPL